MVLFGPSLTYIHIIFSKQTSATVAKNLRDSAATLRITKKLFKAEFKGCQWLVLENENLNLFHTTALDNTLF